MLRANYHTHTNLCDGRDTPEEMAEMAFSRGLLHLGFSGHMDADIHMDWAEYVKRIRKLQDVYRGRMDILLGVELDTMYQGADVSGAEYIIGSTHFSDVECNRGYPGRVGGRPVSVDASPEDMRFLADTYFGGDYYRLAANYFETEAHVYDRLGCTFVGHFDLVCRYNDQERFLDEEDRRYTVPALQAMEYLAGQGVPFEINCGAVNRGRKKEFYPNTFLLKHLKEMGGRILISSDAHDKEHICGAFDRAVEKAIECGFTHTLILEHDKSGRMRTRELALDTLQ